MSSRRDSGSLAKRQSKGLEEDTKQHSRKVIKAIYRRYNVLSSPEADGKHLAFDALLDACEGEPAARRLAARFIPRFAPQFPGKFSMAARSLMELSAWDSHNLASNVQAIAAAARCDAFMGLGSLCALNPEDAATDRTSSSIILHLLRCLHQPKGFKSSSSQNFAEHESVLNAIQTVFRGCPQAMMVACFDSLGSGSGELHDAALEAVQSFLHILGDDESWAQLAKLNDWLLPAAQKLRGRAKSEELKSVLDNLVQAVSKSKESKLASSKVDDSELLKAEQDPLRHELEELPGPPAAPGNAANESTETPQSFKAKAKDDPRDRIKKDLAARAESGELAIGLLPEPPSKSEDEEEQLPPVPTPVASKSERSQGNPLSPDMLPKPGGACCLAFECLWLGGIQAHMVGEAQIRRACEEFGAVKRVVFMYSCGQALVFFNEMSHTVGCYEAMNGNVVLSRKPLTVQFCEDAPEVANQPNPPLRLVVWVAMPDPRSQLERVLNELRTSAVPKPTKISTVGGHCPGALLHFATGPAANAAVIALRSSANRDPARPKSSNSKRSDSPRSPATRPRSPALSIPSTPLPDFATSTLWIGQVGPDVPEEELIDAFKRHGHVISYKLIRPSNCGFIDFERVQDAASARAALHEATFASCQIRVEFKEEGRALGRVGPVPFVPRGAPPGRAPRGRGRGRGRFDPRDSWPNDPSAFRGRGRGRGPWRGGHGRFNPDWVDNDWHERRDRSPLRSPSPQRFRRNRSPGRSLPVSERRPGHRREVPLGGRPSPDYNEGPANASQVGKRRRSPIERTERRPHRSRSRSRSRHRDNRRHTSSRSPRKETIRKRPRD